MLCQLGAHHTAGISCLAFSPSSGSLCSTSLDGTVAIWDPARQTDKCLHSLTGHSDSVNCVVFHPGDESTFFTGSDDSKVLVWDLRNLAMPRSCLDGMKDAVNRIAISSDGQRTYSASDDGCVYVHSLSTALPLIPVADQFMVSEKTCNDVTVLSSPFGDLLCSCSEEGAVRIWTTTIDQQVPRPVPQQNSPGEEDAEVDENKQNEALFEDDDDAPSDVNLQALAAAAGNVPDRMLMNFDQFEMPVNHCTLLGGGGLLLCACAENVFALPLDSSLNGQLNVSSEIVGFSGHEDYVRGMHFSPCGNVMYTVSDDTTVMEWDVASQKAIRRVKVHDAMVMASALRSDGELLATGSEDHVIRLWRLPFETETLLDNVA